MTPEEIATILAQHAEWLRDTSKGARANLRDANMRDANLRDADLRGANLRGANLRDADLHYADLRDANLRYTDMRGAALHYADLSGANLRGADLRDANLRDANLRGADLDFAAWPLWCGSLDVKLDERQQAQLLYHALAVSPVALRMATPEMLEFANGSHIVREHGQRRLTASQPEAQP